MIVSSKATPNLFFFFCAQIHSFLFTTSCYSYQKQPFGKHFFFFCFAFQKQKKRKKNRRKIRPTLVGSHLITRTSNKRTRAIKRELLWLRFNCSYDLQITILYVSHFLPPVPVLCSRVHNPPASFCGFSLPLALADLVFSQKVIFCFAFISFYSLALFFLFFIPALFCVQLFFGLV